MALSRPLGLRAWACRSVWSEKGNQEGYLGLVTAGGRELRLKARPPARSNSLLTLRVDQSFKISNTGTDEDRKKS